MINIDSDKDNVNVLGNELAVQGYNTNDADDANNERDIIEHDVNEDQESDDINGPITKPKESETTLAKTRS